MVREVPQEDFFSKALKYSKWSNKLFWISFVISIILQLTNQYTKNISYIDTIKTSISVFLLIIIFMFDIVTNYYTDNGESTRRTSFIDNSFGTKYCTQESKNYYDNDELGHGLYKLLINLYENTFYTKKNLEIMLEKITAKTIFYLLILILLAIIGFSNCAIAVSILQIFLSKKVLMKEISTHNYYNNVKKVYDEITGLFNLEITDEKASKFQAKIIELLIMYEASISSNRVQLSGKAFNDNNEKWLEEWKVIKNRYRI